MEVGERRKAGVELAAPMVAAAPTGGSKQGTGAAVLALPFRTGSAQQEKLKA
jgi:hypothetical protein